MLSYGCGPCVGIAKDLISADIGDWGLVVMMRGSPTPGVLIKHEADLPDGMATDGSIRLPANAKVIEDPEGRWFRELAVTATPTVLAAVNGRLVDQEVAPTRDWFVGIEQRRRSAGDERLNRVEVN
jgi:hypothetical protein